jgi:hypothetical protein
MSEVTKVRDIRAHNRAIQKIVDEEIKNILDIELNLNKKVSIFGNVMDVPDAISLYYQDIDALHRKYPQYPSVLDLMYKSLMKTAKYGVTCVSNLIIITQNSTMIYATGQIDFKNRDKIQEYSNEFFADVLGRLKFCGYIIYDFKEYSVFPDGHVRNHTNSIIVVNFKDYILIYHYEPHGKPTRLHPFKTFFLNFFKDGIAQASGKEVRLLESSDSCPVGLQAKDRRDRGYCMLWSSFWIYMLFKVLIKSDKSSFRKMFEESDAKKMENTFAQLEPIILKSKYIHNTNNLFQLILKYAIVVLNEYDTHPARPDANKFLSRENTMKILAPDIKYSNLLKNNQKCKKNKQCKSQLCVKGYCRRPTDSRPRKLFEAITGRPPKSQESQESKEKDEMEERLDVFESDDFEQPFRTYRDYSEYESSDSSHSDTEIKVVSEDMDTSEEE